MSIWEYIYCYVLSIFDKASVGCPLAQSPVRNGTQLALLSPEWGECLLKVRETGVQPPGQIIPKTQKMVLDATLLNIQHCKISIKGKVE